jgi:SpoIID/LytB domain protein
MFRPNHSGIRAATCVAAFSACAVFFCSCARSDPTRETAQSTPQSEAAPGTSQRDVDRALQQAAVEALGEREGAVLVMDPLTGRLRAVAAPRLAFEQAFPPGSSIKPFTALAAMRTGLIDAESRTLCGGRYRQGGFQVVCSHPKSALSFDLTQALAYSCNIYFAGLSERLSASSFRGMLAKFGLGARTGVNASAESEGALSAGEWQVQDALGVGDHLLVTPVQLLTAYSALMNGGHVYRPQISAAENFSADERATFHIDAAHRAALIKGCRAVVEYGTGSDANLASLPLFIFGKTGTSISSSGFRTQGWFVSFAADHAGSPDPPPESLRLAVLVFLKRAHGAEGADVARLVYEAYANNGGLRIAGSGLGRPEDASRAVGNANDARSDNPQAAIQNPTSVDPQPIRVRLLRENRTVTLGLEDYLLGVLALEAAAENEIEALKAQAVVSRTYALKNLGRHARDGYDLCSNTHCQQYRHENTDDRSPLLIDAYRRAIGQTEGQVLRGEGGRLADAYFSAACGGVTANIESLWGGAAPSYLRGVRDDYCASGEHHAWRDEIPGAQLARALRTDPRSDGGARLSDIVITKRDGTGRAESISIEGERRRQLSGWEFKIIVGRVLGWMVLKSTRFEVSRRGPNFVFRGSGFGHGLGLCQQGAHVMARRGVAYRQILEHYFPGTSVGGERAGDATTGRGDEPGTGRLGEWQAEYRLRPIALMGLAGEGSLDDGHQRSLKSEHFHIIYPASVERSEIESILRALEAADKDMRRRLALASINLPAAPALDVVIHGATQNFTAATGQPWFAAGATRGRGIQLQPISVLRRRRILESTLRHEYAHAVIETVGEGRTPRWLAEGLAIHFAGEGAMLRRFESKNRPPLDELERKLVRPASAPEMRALYAAASREVRLLIQKESESHVWRRVAAQ